MLNVRFVFTRRLWKICNMLLWSTFNGVRFLTQSRFVIICWKTYHCFHDLLLLIHDDTPNEKYFSDWLEDSRNKISCSSGAEMICGKTVWNLISIHHTLYWRRFWSIRLLFQYPTTCINQLVFWGICIIICHRQNSNLSLFKIYDCIQYKL